MELIALSVAVAAFFAAGASYREAMRSSNRKLARTVHEELEALELERKKLRRDWEEERDRLVKQARRTGATLKRLEEVMEEEPDGDERGEEPDVRGGDARGSQGGQLPPMRQNVATLPWRGGRTG